MSVWDIHLERESLRCVLCFRTESWRQYVVPSDIRVQLLYRRAAPGKQRPRDQPLWRESILLLGGRAARSHFHASWCPQGHGNSSENLPRALILSGGVRECRCAVPSSPGAGHDGG